jgi:dynein heavy chain
LSDSVLSYARGIRIAVLRRDVGQSEELRKEMVEAGLPLPPAKKLAPEKGKLQLEEREYSFKDIHKQIASKHFSSSSEVAFALNWLYRDWQSVQSKLSFMDTSETCLDNKPWHLPELMKAQRNTCSETVAALLKKWRSAFAETVTDCSQQVFDLFVNDIDILRQSPLHPFLLSCRLRMALLLRELISNSARSLEDLIEQHTLVEVTEHGKHTTPLLHAEVTVHSEGGKAAIHPSQGQTEASLTALVDEMCEASKTITAIDPKVASMVSFVERPLLSVESGDPLCEGLDEQLLSLRNKIRHCVHEAYKGPLELASKFQTKCWVLEIFTPEYVEAFFDESPSHENVIAKVQTFHDLATEVGSIDVAYDDEMFPIAQVNTTEAKKTIIIKAMEVRDALLSRVVEDLSIRNENTVHTYDEMLSTLSTVPSTEQELDMLRTFMAETPPRVDQLMEDVLHVHEQMSIVDLFGYKVSDEDGLLNWTTMTYPQKVKEALDAASTTQETRQAKLLDELNDEKDVFEKLLEQYARDLVKCKELGNYDHWEDSAVTVNELYDGLQNAKRTVADFNAREAVFRFPPTEYPQIENMERELDPFFRLWNMIAEFNSNQKEWMSGSFLAIDAPQVEMDVVEWFKSSAKMAKTLADDYPLASECAKQLREVTGDFRKHLPVLVALATPALKQRHWDQLSQILEVEPAIEPSEDLTLEELLGWGVADHIEEIEEMSVHANKQFGLEKQLSAMKADWSPIEFEVKDYRNTGTCIIGGLDDIIALLDEHIVKTQTMRGSPFSKGIKEECEGWQHQLMYGQDMLDEWIKVQRTWMYLEPIFGSEDIMRQLPTEARRFNDVDKIWRKVMAEAKDNPTFLYLAIEDKGFKQKFISANDKLEKVQKGLNDYLEVKRKYFPRFFFLSNDELLEILSQTKDPKAVQPHLGKAFEGIAKVKFESDLKISQLIAAKGEKVDLDEPIDPEKGKNKGNVECWLLELEHMQWRTLKTQTELGLKDYHATPRNDWTLKWPQQVILAGSSVNWTIEVNDVLSSGGCEGLANYIQTVLNPQLLQIVELVRGKLNKVQMSTLGALVVIDVHARDTCDMMVGSKVESVHDFNWVSQLRYAWDPSWKKGQAVEKGDDTLVCKIVNAKALYGYEYLGNSMRLVITPLTDRCYRTMIGAIELLYGGAPEGPAGTGKTETVKDLSKAVAIHCVVFNCSDSMDYLQMAKFFKGLAGCGSWCCFDEFNRINIEVLSVIAQQILTINNAKKRGLEVFHFEGTHMKLNNNCNAFITMNPGYAGRTELPDNLKALFRPCAMMVPDYAMIGEIRLYSFGFGEPRPLAQKLVKVLQLSSEQLSSQKHYDYGMRAVQSILVACGNMRMKVGDDPDWSEAKIVLRSVYDVNLPKFTVEDLPLFKGITSDLFPGIDLPVADHGPLLACIDEQCRVGVNVAPGRTFKQEPIESYTNKIRELYEMVLVRHGVMIFGETGSGKTVGLHCLKQALTVCNSRGQNYPKVNTFTMNPKSIKSSQLYGNFDENTHEWSDGILPVLYRIGARDTSSDRNWVVFDGPVDAVWIENMNTVLDDNKKLCLNSGEIIKMSDEMTMMFEAEDLEQASPATISRVGMIYCETRNVGWRPLRNVWLDSLETEFGGEFFEQRDNLEQLFEWLFLPSVFYVQNYCRIPAPVSIGMMCASLLRLLTCFFSSPEGFASDQTKVCESLFIKALYWSVGAAVDGASRSKFDAYVRLLLTGNSDGDESHANFLSKNRSYNQEEFGPRKALLVPKCDDEGCDMIFDVRFDAKKGLWVPWVEAGVRSIIPKSASYNSIVVPTVDTVRHEWLMNELLLNNFHVLCTGDTGTGKSVSIKQKLINGMDEKYTSIFLNFSAQTGANQTQDIIDGKVIYDLEIMNTTKIYDYYFVYLIHFHFYLLSMYDHVVL